MSHPAAILDKAPTIRGCTGALVRFSVNKRNHPVPTMYSAKYPTPSRAWDDWKHGRALLTTDGCSVNHSGDKCQHGHPTFFLRYFLDLGA